MKRVLWATVLTAQVAMGAGEQIYVIHTYGDPAIVDIAQDELNRGGGGTARLYQDKLIIKAKPADYARVSALIGQIDTAPASLTVSLAIDNQINQSERGGQVQVGISRQVWVNGRYQNTQSTNRTNNVYTARTLSGSSVSIGTSTLVGLSSYQVLGRGQTLWVNFGTSWLALNEGFVALPKLLPNGQIGLSLSAYNHQNTQQNQLNTTLTLPKGQWTQIGQMSITDSTQRAGFAFGSSQYRQSTPIWVKVD